MKTLIWQVQPATVSEIYRHCKKCGTKTAFTSSGLFRVNAQRKSLDIWLIYNCRSCRTSWNATIFSRISPQALGHDALEQYMGNDPELAASWASNLHFLKSLGCQVEPPVYTISGEVFSPTESVTLEIQASAPLPIRVSALLREKLGLSRRDYEALLDGGQLTAPDGQDLRKCRLNGGIRLQFGGEEPIGSQPG